MKLRSIIAKLMRIILQPPALVRTQKHKTAKVCSGSHVTNAIIGKYSYIGNNCFVVTADIGSFCSIADGVRIGGAYHPVERVSTSPVFHQGKNVFGKTFSLFPIDHLPRTVIGNDVWIGANVCVKSGVSIGNGAVIGMGSIVTHDVPSYEIWAGNPARCIRKRFESKVAEKLEEINWWDWDDSKIEEYADCFDDPRRLFEKLGEYE